MKPLGAFSPNGEHRRTVCRPCRAAQARWGVRKKQLTEHQRALRREAQRRWNRAHPEVQRRLSRIHAHKRATRHLGWHFSWAIWERILAYWQHACAHCGWQGTPLEIDHIIPVRDARCPGTVPWNIVPSCRACNRTRRARPVSDAIRTFQSAMRAEYGAEGTPAR